jgi:hypothetical protein
MSQQEKFLGWAAEVRALAHARGLDWLLGDDIEDLRSSFRDGDTPGEALEHLVAEVNDNC